MRTPINILVIEDSEEDCLDLTMQLKTGGVEPSYQFVSSCSELDKVFDNIDPDLIIADISKPHFDVFEALQIYKNRDIDIPFIILSDRKNEETAIAAMMAGAHDYVLKENLARIIPVINREMKETVIRLQYRWIVKTLQMSENLFRSQVDPSEEYAETTQDITLQIKDDNNRKGFETFSQQSPVIIFLRRADKNWSVVYVSENVEKQFGYSPNDFYASSLSFASIIHPDDLNKVTLDIKRLSNSGKTSSTQEYRIITKDNQIRFIEDHIQIRHNNKGNITHYQGILIDITGRKKIEEHLRKSEEKYERLFEDAILGIFQSTFDGKFIAVNKAYTKMFGYESAQEIISSLDANDIFVDAGRRQYLIDTVMQSDGTIRTQNLYRRKDGSTFIGNLYAWRVSDINGQEHFIEGFIEDITDRIKAEKALLSSEVKYLGIIENFREGIILTDEKGVVIEWNQGVENITGVLKNETLDRYVWDVLSIILSTSNQTSQQAQNAKEYIEKILVTGTSSHLHTYFEYPLIRRDGAQRIIESLIFPIKTEKGFMIGSILRDISERKRTEEILRMREQEFRALVENTPDAIQRFDAEYRNIYANPAVQHLFKKAPDEIIGESLFNINMSDEAKLTWKEALQEAFDEQHEVTFESAHTTPEAVKYYQTRVVPEISTDKAVHTVLCITSDITDIKQTQEALERSEEQYRTMVENINEVIFNLDADNHITYISPAVTHILGYQPEEMLEKPFVRFVHSADVSSLGLHLVKSLMTKMEPFEFRMIDKNGKIHDLSISTSPRLDGDILIGISGVISDLTERKRMRKALEDSQKMVDIGTLTAGVAHEIKSPLQVITSISESIMHQLMEKDYVPEDILKQLETINRNGWRISKIASSLLNYARATDGEIEMNDLNEIITDSLLLIEHQLSSWSNIFVTTDLAEKLPSFPCDRNKITQVLINLLTNARDAMIDGGEIKIKTGFEPQTKQLVLKVSDNGIGIPEEIQDHIFEPFFTTKSYGIGTGLGLHIVSDILHAHNGSIEIESTSDTGTTICIRLPSK